MIEINIYTVDDTWYYSLYVGGEYDSGDVLDVADGASVDDAVAEAQEMPLMAAGPRQITVL